MGYYNNNRGNNRNNNRGNGRAHHGQNYIWVVYNFKQGRNHTFTNKVQALRYYYEHEFDCLSPDKRDD